MRGLASLIGGHETNAIQSTAWGEWGDSGSVAWSGNQVNSTNATQLLTVFGCVSLICDSISTLPVDAFLQGPNDTKTPEPLPDWLIIPVPGITRTAWLTQIVSSLLLDGNAYLAILYGFGGRITSMPTIDPKRVKVERRNGIKTCLIDGAPATFPVLHIPAIMRAGCETGLSPIEAARQSIGLGMAAQEYGAKFFGQGTTMSGVIEVTGELPATGDGSAPGLARQVMRRHSGKSKSHLPLVLQGGATWKDTGVTNDQAQFLQTREFTAAEIAGQMFLIDPTDLGIAPSGSNIVYGNLEQRNARRVQVTLLRWIIRLEEAFSSLLPFGYYIKLNVNGLLRGDLTSRYAAYGVGIDKGFLLRSEVRASEDLPPVDGIDTITPPAPPVPAPTGGAA